jgi:hypothetical protein
MTRFVVQAIWDGTSKTLAVSGHNAAAALLHAMKMRETKGASIFIVRNRKTGQWSVHKNEHAWFLPKEESDWRKLYYHQHKLHPAPGEKIY